MSRIGIIGAGAFGTALGCVLARDGRDVLLWGRNGAHIDAMAANRRNRTHLPGCALPDRLTPTAALSDLSGISTLLVALPAQALAGFLADAGLPAGKFPVVLCAKGIDLASVSLQTDLLAAACPAATAAVLTGPGFADDLARSKPTAMTLACRDRTTGKRLQAQLSTPVLRLYLSSDPVGAQLGGALKNVTAIACGAASGAGLGESARAALITRGYAEMVRLGTAMGARRETLSGLSGFGDLALTCTSEKSRNYALGLAIGEGREPAPGVTVEGIATARATVNLASTLRVDMPVAEAVASLLDGRTTVQAALHALMSRPLRTE